MTIRTRFTSLFLAIFSVLLLIFCLVIYFESEYHREQEYRTRLRNETLTAAAIFFNKESISPDLFKTLAQKQMTVLNREEVKIYDSQNRILYESGSESYVVDTARLNQIWKLKELFWHEGDLQMYATIIPNKSENYLVLTSALDKYGLSNQRNLGYILFFGAVVMIVLALGIGWLLASSFLNPINQIIKRVDKITESSLSLRLEEGENRDEFWQLTLRFNQMLDRLERAFAMQKAFVSHASHELRTPLTSITGQIQVSLLAQDNTEELKSMILSVLEDVQQLNKLTNNLLDLTSIDGNDRGDKLVLVNLSELLMQVRSDILKSYSNAQILLEINEIEESLPEIRAVEHLLYIAFSNLIENGLKFSNNNKVEVTLSETLDKYILSFFNVGLTITEAEKEDIFEPFKRGINAHKTKGHGVGLSLTKKIIELHKGKIEFTSSETTGTIFKLLISKNL